MRAAASTPAPGPKLDAETATPIEQLFAASGTDPLRKQIAEDCALLLKLVTDLRVETQKSNADVLSMDVVRKARQIQELARKVQQEMKTAMGKT